MIEVRELDIVNIDGDETLMVNVGGDVFRRIDKFEDENECVLIGIMARETHMQTATTSYITSYGVFRSSAIRAGRI